MLKTAEMLSHAGPPSLLLVSHKRTGGREKAEVVTAAQPAWGSSIEAPASWDAFEPDHLQVRSCFCWSTKSFQTSLPQLVDSPGFIEHISISLAPAHL